MAESADDVGEVSEDAVKEQQARLLIKSLAAMRVAEKADVIIVCGEREFYAHKVILEANSPYFTFMFKSNLEEAKSGKIFFSELDPETLDAILDFMYLGDVKKMKTEEMLMNVLKASHMMQLKNLFQYCANSLLQFLTPESFVTIMMLADKYDIDRMSGEVKTYFLYNSVKIFNSQNFLMSSITFLKNMVVVFKAKFLNHDHILHGIVLWILYDLPTREQFTEELFSYIDANLLSLEFVKSLLTDSEPMTNSKELTDGLKELLVKIVLAGKQEFSTAAEKRETNKIETTHLQICGLKLLYWMQRCSTNAVEAQETAKLRYDSYIQVFDVGTSTWQPVKPLPTITFKVDALCQSNDGVLLVGGTAGNVYVLYDVKESMLTYMKTTNNLSIPNASACYFANHMYLLGGSTPDDQVMLDISDRTWYKTSPFKHHRTKPVLFASESYMFAVGGNSFLSKPLVEYASIKFNWQKVPGKCFVEIIWRIVELPTDFVGVDVYFFPHKNQLCGWCNWNDATIKLSNSDNKWDIQELPKSPLHTEIDASSFFYFPTDKTPIVLISSEVNNHGIPNYALDVSSFKWAKLPVPKGTCEIKECENLMKTTCYIP